MPFPEDIRIVKIAVAKTRVGRFLCGWKKPLEVLKFQRFQYRVRRRVKEFSVLHMRCLHIQPVNSRQGGAVFFQIRKGFQRRIFAHDRG